MDMSNDSDLRLTSFLNQYLDWTAKGMPPEKQLSAQYNFSVSFENRMRPLLRKARKQQARQQAREEADQQVLARHSNGALRKKLVLVAIVLAILAATLSITAARDAVWSFIVHTYEKYSGIIFETQDPGETAEPTDSLSPEDVKVPAGYTENRRLQSDYYLLVIYTNAAGDELHFEKTANEALQMTIDTEGVQVHEITVRGYVGLYYSTKGYQTVIWQEGYYVYVLFGKLTKEELINMVE